MKAPFKIISTIIAIHLGTAIAYFGYRVLFDSKVAVFKVTKVSEVGGINKALLGRGNAFCYKLDFEMQKSEETSIHGIYVKSYFKPDFLPKKGDVICGTLAYVRPSSVTDFFKVFYGEDDWSLRNNYSIVTNKSPKYISSLFGRKSKSFLSSNLASIGLLSLLLVLGILLNRYLKPSIKKKNDEITFNKPAWLEFSNALMGCTLLLLSCHLFYKTFVNEYSIIYTMLLFFMIIGILVFLYLEFKNRKDYLILRPNSISYKDNQIIEEIHVDEIQSFYFRNKEIILHKQDSFVTIKLHDMNLKAYTSIIQQEIRTILKEKREESGEE
jgi:hypothetical protein